MTNVDKRWLLAVAVSAAAGAAVTARVLRRRRLKAQHGDHAEDLKTWENEGGKPYTTKDFTVINLPYFDYAEVLLQISIVMASVSILASSRGIFFFALSAAIMGGFLSANGFLLFFRLPFLH